jgi:hypothetical protein
MPSRKQRRRREKTFRHQYDLVVFDEDGNEVPVDRDELRTERAAKDKQRASAKPATGGRSGRGGRPLREPPQPTWQRAIRRGGAMGALMLLAFIFVFKNGPIGSRLAIGLLYGVAFIPLTYFVDRTAYRTFQRRAARADAKKT